MQSRHASNRAATMFSVTLLVAFLLFAPLGTASADAGTKYDHYLLLVIEASSPAARGWAEPIVLSHDRAGKVIVADSLDCNDLYTIGGKQVKMGSIYSIGGENLVMSVINVSYGLGITKYAKTTYMGLDHVARIMGGSLNVNKMIEASKSSDRSSVRKEQLRFIEAISYGLHNLSIIRMFALLKASFSYCDSNINIWEAFNLTRDLIGGTFIPRDGKELAISL